jgi:NADPH-dependent 2,4-dienoyl-CoA reductase/sulfur reductase-like enzyme
VSEHVVLVGASLTAVRAIDTARKLGYDGRITLVGAEPHLPYDRPPLSKGVLVGTKSLADNYLRSQEWYDQNGIELLLSTRATALNLDRQVVYTDSGSLSYDRLLIATGCRARSIPGQQLDGAFVLRTTDDADHIRLALEAGPRVVVIGGGFIGGEVASSARALGLDVTIVEALPQPMSRFGATFAESYLATHLDHGVSVIAGAGVDGFEGVERVEGVRLVDGSTIPADLVVVGVGTHPNVEWLASSGLDVSNGVVCDEYLRATRNVFAAGDVASWKNPYLGESNRIEHWTNAVEQGVAAGALLAGAPPVPHTSVPYFWSDQHERRFQYAGRDPIGLEPITITLRAPGATLYLYRSGAELAAVAGTDCAAIFMKLRRGLVNGISWDDAMALVTDA